MRPTYFLVVFILALAIVDAGLYLHAEKAQSQFAADMHILNITTAALGLTDLCVATEARYTRHPAISDRTTPFMDHPGAIEHFPTGSFWAPIPRHLDDD